MLRPLLFGGALVVALSLFGCRSETPAPDAPPVQTVALASDTSQYGFDTVMAYAREADLHARSLGAIMQAVGEQFLGAPYVAGLLDAPETETLMAPTDKFDCVLFVETALAMARGIKAQDYAHETFLHHIQNLRYREGAMDGYCSRLHYFSEWIADNAARGTVRNVTQALGGEPLDKTLDFMSTHRGSYPRFAENDSLFSGIQAMEARLSDLDLHYIPQDRIHEVYDRLRAGDIIATATHLEGLDVTHTGLVYKGEPGQTGFLHASTSGGVMISPDLEDYVQGVKAAIGIIVARPVEPGSTDL